MEGGGKTTTTIISQLCIYFIYKSLNKIGDSEINIGFHLPYLNGLTGSEREGLLFHCFKKDRS